MSSTEKMDDDFYRQDDDTSESDEETTVESDLTVEERSTSNDEQTVSLTDKQRRRQTRLRQRRQTKELATLDLIDDSNRSMRQLLRVLGVSTDAFNMIMRLTTAKDKELVRLRRELLRSQRASDATRNNLLPRLRSKAHQAKVLMEATNAMQAQKLGKARGRVARSLVREA